MAQNSLYAVITTQEAAQSLGLSERSIRNYCEQGKLEARKSGQTWLILAQSCNIIKSKMEATKMNKMLVNGNEYELVFEDGEPVECVAWRGHEIDLSDVAILFSKGYFLKDELGIIDEFDLMPCEPTTWRG